jgi:hypothetical protein
VVSFLGGVVAMPDKETPLVHQDKPAGVARRSGQVRTGQSVSRRDGRLEVHLKHVRWCVETVRGVLFGRKVVS